MERLAGAGAGQGRGQREALLVRSFSCSKQGAAGGAWSRALVSGDGRRDGEATRGRRPGSGGKLLDGARSEEEEASAWSLRRSGDAGKIPTTMRRQQQKLEAGPEPAGVDAGERESEEAGMALRLLRRLQQTLGARPWLGVGEGRQGRRGTTGSLTGEREEAAPASEKRQHRRGSHLLVMLDGGGSSGGEGERGGCAVAGDELSKAATMAAGWRREDCGCGCRRSGACRRRRNDDGAEQRERTGGAPEETPLREREENFLSLDRVR